MPPEGYGVITLSQDVLGKIDTHADHIGAETRAEAIRDLLRQDTESIEERLKRIESELKAVDKADGQSFVSRVQTLESKVDSVQREIERIRKTMEGQA